MAGTSRAKTTEPPPDLFQLRVEVRQSIEAAGHAIAEYDAVRKNSSTEDRASLLRLADAARRAGDACQEVAKTTLAYTDADAKRRR